MMEHNFDFLDALTPAEKAYLKQEAMLNQLLKIPAPKDWEKWAQETLERKRQTEEEIRLAQERKAKKTRQKAQSLNMTVEQYEVHRKRQQRIARYKREIKKCEDLLAQAQRDKTYWEHKLQLAEAE